MGRGGPGGPRLGLGGPGRGPGDGPRRAELFGRGPDDRRDPRRLVERAPAEAAGWYTYFDNLRRELDAYAAAKTWDEASAALERVQAQAAKLDVVSFWAPAAEIRSALTEWLNPRLRLARAARGLSDALAASAPADDPNRRDWTTFVNDKLGQPLRDFESAKTVQARTEAGSRLRAALDALRRSASWPYAAALQAAADEAFNVPEPRRLGRRRTPCYAGPRGAGRRRPARSPGAATSPR